MGIKFAYRNLIFTSGILFSLISINGCSSKKISASEIPASVAVSEISIPYHSNLPTFAIAVQAEPIVTYQEFNQKKASSSNAIAPELLESVFRSSLISVKNFSVVDPIIYKANLKKQTNKNIKKGPFVLKIRLTENEARIEGSGSAINKYDANSSIPMAMGRAFLTFPLFLLTEYTGIPTEYRSSKITGVVGLDIAILEPKSGTILVSFPVQGSYTAKEVEVGSTISGYHSRDSARSIFENALRIAFNEAAKKSFTELSLLYQKGKI